MKFESLDNSGDTAMSIIFEPNEVPILLDITEQYLSMEYDLDDVANFVNSAIFAAMVDSKQNRVAFKIDLDSEKTPVFIDKINESAAKYLAEQIQFWQTITPRHPEWLSSKMASSIEDIAVSNTDKAIDPFNGVYLDKFEIKLARDAMFTRQFQQKAREISQ